MFPNVRLIIAAIAASIVGISCGLGVFAAFRVNHDPFARLPSSAPPLQLVFSNAAPDPVTDAAATPFGVRFPLNAPQLNALQSGGAAAPAEPASGEPNATAAMPSPEAQDADPKKDGVRDAAIEQSAPQSAPADSIVQDSKPKSTDQAEEDRKPAPQRGATAHAKAPAKAVRAPAKLPRVAAKPRRVRTVRVRAILQSADEGSGYAQPAYPFPTPVPGQPAKRRRAASQ